MLSNGGEFREKWMNEMEEWIDTYRDKEYPKGEEAYDFDINADSVDAWFDKQFPIFRDDLLKDLAGNLSQYVKNEKIVKTLVGKIEEILNDHRTEEAVAASAFLIDILACEQHTSVSVYADEEETCEFLKDLAEKHPSYFTKKQNEAILGVYENKEWEFPVEPSEDNPEASELHHYLSKVFDKINKETNEKS
jgi:hypothetical protein